MDRLHQLSVNGVSMIKNCRTFNFNVSNVNFEINLRVGIISKFRESSFQSVFNSWAVINMHVLITAHELYIYYNFVNKTIHLTPLIANSSTCLCNLRKTQTWFKTCKFETSLSVMASPGLVHAAKAAQRTMNIQNNKQGET